MQKIRNRQRVKELSPTLLLRHREEEIDGGASDRNSIVKNGEIDKDIREKSFQRWF